MSETHEKSNFLTQIIEADLESGKHDTVVTRFPPEPNGYLHIGHSKSILLNYGLAQQYGGRFHLRFDDTNPSAEEVEYVQSIQQDVKWLGADFGEHLYFGSDYFDRMYELAELLIEKGLAYVDSSDRETIRAHRGTLTEPGTPTPFRDRSVEENLDLFRRMKAGEFENGAHVLRAKIDLANPNMQMRDPVLYRIQHAHHHNTGDEWCIYPMYDFAHCLEDSFEGITHSICTLEFENNRELYDWLIEKTEVEHVPRQYEFARLALSYTVMSKRKLLRLVKEGHVDGWDDPRMPTIAAYRRRGVRREAIQRFTDIIGVAKANSVVDVELLEFAIRDDLNMLAPRVMCVVDPLKVTITNFPEGEIDTLTCPYYPHDVPLEGDRDVPFTREIYIERADFAEEKPKGWRRLSPGAEVRLRYAYYVTCDEVVKDENGEVIELKCSYDPDTRGGSSSDGRKVQGTIHWVSASEGVGCEVRIYDRLFRVPDPDAGEGDFLENLNPESLIVRRSARVEPSVLDDPPTTRYQFERQGYFWRDPIDSSTDNLVFNQIVSLKDSWGKKTAEWNEAQAAKTATTKSEPEGKQDGTSRDSDRPQKRSASYERDKAREENPALARAMADFVAMGLDEDDADLLSGDDALVGYFRSALTDYDRPNEVAKWIVNSLLPALDDMPITSTNVRPHDVAKIVRRIDEGKITAASSTEVLDEVMKTSRDPDAIIAEKGLERIDDAGALESIVDTVLEENPDEVGRYRDGKKSLFGFFIGRVMAATGGQADAAVVREVLQKKL